MPLGFLETGSLWSQIFVLAFSVLALVAGAAALFFAEKSGKLKDDALERFKAESARDVASANARAELAIQGTAVATAEAAKANERAGALEVEAARQKERAAKAEMALLELQQRVAPRGLTGHARVSLVNALRTATPGKVDFACISSDGEGVQYMNELASAIREAGWPIVGMIHNQGGPNPVGVLLLLRSIAEPPPHAATLLAALQAAEISPLVGPDDDVPADTVRLWIGRKAR